MFIETIFIFKETAVKKAQQQYSRLLIISRFLFPTVDGYCIVNTIELHLEVLSLVKELKILKRERE